MVATRLCAGEGDYSNISRPIVGHLHKHALARLNGSSSLCQHNAVTSVIHPIERHGIAVVVKQIGIACEGVANQVPTVERGVSDVAVEIQIDIRIHVGGREMHIAHEACGDLERGILLSGIKISI